MMNDTTYHPIYTFWRMFWVCNVFTAALV